MGCQGPVILHIAIAHKNLFAKVLDIPIEQLNTPTEDELPMIRAGVVQFYNSTITWQDSASLDVLIDQLIEAEKLYVAYLEQFS